VTTRTSNKIQAECRSGTKHDNIYSVEATKFVAFFHNIYRENINDPIYLKVNVRFTMSASYQN